MKALIFGTGSIACRHSRILSELGYIVTGVSSRDINLNEIYHTHNFSKVLPMEHWKDEDADIFIIATVTCLHSELVQELISSQVKPNKIFCEKPGPKEFLGINILYNLQYLDILDDIGPAVEVRHCADARLWPSDIDWRDRYVFNNVLGGGVFLTHSHELIHCFSASRPRAVCQEDKTFIADKDNTKLCTYFKGVIDNIQFELDLMSVDPVRYWHHQDVVLHFYGNLPKRLNSEKVIKVTSTMVEYSYFNMWESMLTSSDTRLQSDFTWVLENVL